jgi:hypothetical protein
MRAILIDPEQRTISEIQLDSDDYREIQKVLRCDSFMTAAHLAGSIDTGFDAVYASDDEFAVREDDLSFWFQVDADCDPPSCYPIAGLGLALGADMHGKGCDVGISVAELTSRITFTKRKFRGFETFTGEEARARGKDIVVEVKAPIIDGTDER